MPRSLKVRHPRCFKSDPCKNDGRGRVRITSSGEARRGTLTDRMFSQCSPRRARDEMKNCQRWCSVAVSASSQMGGGTPGRWPGRAGRTLTNQAFAQYAVTARHKSVLIRKFRQ
ncbi:hypothetical protein J6590_034078 [Homalodisca vitripennis]|nr:hypothetical protein J6590_034078 [Homalodisca vitripennis]